MTAPRDPPRLRALGRELPADLSLALQDAPDESATTAELARLAWKLRTSAEASAAAERPRARGVRHRGRGPIAAVALTFALGAAAGVAGSSGVFLLVRSTSLEPRSASSAAPSPHSRSVPPPPGEHGPARTEVVPAPSSDVVMTSPRTLREPAHAAVPSAVVESPSPIASSPAASDRSELTLLARAQAALAGNAKAALALTQEHETLFPRGALAQEREVVAIDALLRLGQRGEAVGRAVRFNEQFPGSVHARRIDVLLGRADHK